MISVFQPQVALFHQKGLLSTIPSAAVKAQAAMQAINDPLPHDKKLPVTLLSGFLGE